MSLTVVQLLPELDVGGVERGTVEVARALGERGHHAIVISGGGRLVPELTAAGAEHIAWTVGRKHVSTLGLIRRLRRLFEQRRPDIVHARSRLPAWVGRLALRAMPETERPRWVTTVHGPYTVNRYSRVMVTGDAVIAISEFIRDYILSSYDGVAGDRITVIPRGVDRGTYPYDFQPDPEWLREWREAEPALAGKKILTIAARLTRWKGQDDFVTLIETLLRRGLPVHGLVAGGPHPRKPGFERELRETVRVRGLSDHVSFIGHRPDLREVLSVTDIACSLTHEPEAFGRTTIEALSLGIPVLGYDHGGTGEILRRVYPAGLVPTGDIEHAAAVAASLLSERTPVPETHPYTLEQMLDKTIALYEALA